MARDRLGLRPRQQYRELGVELLLGARVAEIDIERRDIVL
ncbi:MAG TPA: hypothetical protein DCF65_06905, partial [Chloroflexi bacterium]|nr:hypothetical protein [Chloroflexota bacterium]